MKKILVFGLGLFLSVTILANVDVDSIKPKSRGWTPFRLCVTEGAWSWPKKKNVYGLNVGLLSSYNYNSRQEIYGVDFSLVSIESKAKGLQMALTNWSKGSSGVQMAFGNLVKEFTGVQVALGNVARESSVVQIGVLNFARDNTKGVQFGVLNFMSNGFLPFFPIINFSW